MKSITINKLNDNTYKEIEYTSGDELIKAILFKYDPNLNPANTRLSIGDDVFVNWNHTIENCLHYGTSIQIFTFLIHVNIHFNKQTLKIEVDSRQSILSIKSLIKKHFDIMIADQILTFRGLTIHDNIEPLIFYKLKENSSLYVTSKEQTQEQTGKEALIKYCGKSTGISMLLNKNDDVFTIREKIFDKGINPEQYQIRLNDKMLDHLRQTSNGKQYYNHQFDHVESIELYPKHVDTKVSTTSLHKKPKLFKCNINAPEWQITKPGLCLEGICNNKNCRAYHSHVIMNISTPAIYKFGTMSEEISCPICHTLVTPISISFNNTEWRFIGLKKNKNNKFDKIKSDWKYADHTNFQEITESELAEWDSLVIETKNRHNYLTNEFKCDKCLSFHEPIINDEDDDTCSHEFYDPYLSKDQNSKDLANLTI